MQQKIQEPQLIDNRIEDWLTTKEFAKEAKTSTKVILKWIYKGVIVAGKKRRSNYLIHRSEIAKVITDSPSVASLKI